MTLANFSRRMVIRADELGKSVNEVVKTVALQVDQVVVLATPVDTGKARSNWIVSSGSPVLRVNEPYAPGNKLGLGEGRNAAAAIAQAEQAVALRRDGQSIYITNSVDYMASLNNGSSRQAPENFVEMGVVSGVNAVKAVRIFK